jgi:hypothetical protein
MDKDKSKTPMIVLTCFLYASSIMLGILFILIRFGISNDTAIFAFMGLGVAFGIVALIVALINAILALIHVFRCSVPPTKTSMVIKIVLIPFYLMNFFYWALLAAGFCNPWLMLGVPLIITLGAIITFCYMISTSAPNLFYLFRLGKEKKLKANGYYVTAIVFHFFFILDVVGAIMLDHLLKKEEKANTIEIK